VQTEGTGEHNRHIVRTLTFLATLPFVGGTVLAQTPAPRAAAEASAAAWDAIYWAWDAGRYDESLARMERMLQGGGAGPYLDSVALLTGERFRTMPLADSATDALWSADGRYLAVEYAPRQQAGAPSASGQPRVVVFRLDGDSAARVGALAGTSATFMGRTARVAYLSQGAGGSRIVVRDLTSGDERQWPSPGLNVTGIMDGGDGLHLLVSSRIPSEPARTDLYLLGADGEAAALVQGPGPKLPLFWARGGSFLVYRVGADRFTLWERASGTGRDFGGSWPVLSRNDSQLVFAGRTDQGGVLFLLTVGRDSAVAVRRSPWPVVVPAISPDGRRLAYASRPRDDWELFVVNADGTGERRLTHDVQDDLFPQFLGNDRVLDVVGETRHARSYLIDLTDGSHARLFHNNTVRTMCMEYQWVPSPDGTKLVVLAHRDGNTLDRPWGAYLVDLSRTVTRSEVLERVRAQLAAERALRERSRRLVAPLAAVIRPVVADVSARRIVRYAQDLEAFESRAVTRPGNRLAMEYLAARLRDFGYEPELQWYEPRPGVRTANVVARLPGTVNPVQVVVVSSHFDTVEEGPGMEDNGSGTTSLLEAARVLSGHAQPATIVFAFVSGEEIGDTGSREFVRRARADSVHVVANLNNDTFGWTHDQRFNASIRYSNAGIRDVQHAAALEFTRLITYDAVRFQSSDGLTFYQAYGDIVGGLGSYPMLASPHYHESHDITETVNYGLVAEACRTTVASVMLLASSPAPLRGLAATARDGGAQVSWSPAAERGVTSYVVAYGPTGDPLRRRLVVPHTQVVLPDAEVGWRVAVKARTASGLEGWDWARAAVAASAH
jgi:Tol biopolymer transport system component